VKAQWSQLAAWPYEGQTRIPSRFRTTWSRSLDKLEDEIRAVGGSDVLIGIVVADDQLRMDGTPRPNFKVLHPGAEVSFTDESARRLTFHTDRYPHLHDNLHAIASGMEALRAVERHGIASTGQQYAGFQQLGAGTDLIGRGRQLVELHGTLTKALKATHPDTGGNAADFAAVDAYRKARP
jgi:hypothetical protein